MIPVYLLCFFLLFGFRHFLGPYFFHALFYQWKKNQFLPLKTQASFPSEQQVEREKKWTMISALCDIPIFLLILFLTNKGATQFYWNISDYGLLYTIFSFFLLLLTQDFYFYVTHRLMHSAFIFKHVHFLHHTAKNPTPWSAFCVHPLEKILELLYFPLIVAIIPLHPMLLLFFIFMSTLVNILGHSGFEFNIFKNTNRGIHSLGSTATFHNMHHQFVTCNYSLYLSIWDKIFRTEHANYTQALSMKIPKN